MPAETSKVPLRRLIQILELERAKGYNDGAVIGGLDVFLQRWAGDTRHRAGAKGARRLGLRLPKPSYAGLTPARRQRWVEEALHWVKEQTPTSALAPQKPVAVRQSPSTSITSDGRAAASPVTPTPRRAKAVVAGDLTLDSPLMALQGQVLHMPLKSVTEKLKKLGVTTIHDLLYFFPRRHNDFAHLQTIDKLVVDADQTVIGVIWEVGAKLIGRTHRGTEAVIGDETGNVRVVWFNNPYVARSLKAGDRVAISGKVSTFRGQMVFESPEYELSESEDLIHTGRLVPVYPLTEGLYPRTLRRLMRAVLEMWAPKIEDFLPPEVRNRVGLMTLPDAIGQFHYPDSLERREEARRRLAFDELFLIQLGVLSRRREWREGQRGCPIPADPQVVTGFIRSLPFTLTSAQRRVLDEILGDMAQGVPMNRLLQGEVGSGKTVVAACAMLTAAVAGYQAVLMAPTEILAEQHYQSMTYLHTDHLGWLTPLRPSGRPLEVAMLIGSKSPQEKEELHRRISRGEVDIVIGTHALIQEGVQFHRLGLAIVDEQHRFGVMQRAALRQKGFNPHLLVMTATPIPRTLALTLYGDLDISIIDEMPPGRQEIKTRWLAPHQRRAAYEFVRKEAQAGRQAFIICPLIEESEAIEARAATVEYERLSQVVFPDLGLGLLHGRQPSTEKDEVMRRFRAGELNILVSTPVVEVGIDVPNATVMLVEGADRFGLAQLHQFRGRVGRGEHQSYCILLAESPSEEARQRLSALEKTQNGFQLAEEDLKLRGPGEFFGTRQSGLPDLRVAQFTDVDLLQQAREEAQRLFASDPGLERREHWGLVRQIAQLWRGKSSDLN